MSSFASRKIGELRGRLRAFTGAALDPKSVHPKRPLQADHGTFNEGHKGEGQSDDKWQPKGCMDNVGGVPGPLDNKYKRNNHVAYDENREIGRRIVRSLVVQFLTAIGARIRNFHEFSEHMAFATRGTFTTRAPPHRLFQGAVSGVKLCKMSHLLRLGSQSSLQKGQARRAAACRKSSFFAVRFGGLVADANRTTASLIGLGFAF
jgi:hypothetical protein